MSDQIPISHQANYVTPTAIGYADEAGFYVQVTEQVPLPVAGARAAAAPAPLEAETGQSLVAGPYTPLPDVPIHLELRGEWSGSVELQRSIDGGATRSGLTVGGMPWARFDGNANEIVWQEGERGATLYLDIAIASGTLEYRVSQ